MASTAKATVAPTKKRTPQMINVSLLQMIVAGIIVAPLKIYTAFKHQEISGLILKSGKVKVDGVEYKSLSQAGRAVQNSIGVGGGEKGASVNGWVFWQYQDKATSEMHPMSDLRALYVPPAETPATDAEAPPAPAKRKRKPATKKATTPAATAAPAKRKRTRTKKTAAPATIPDATVEPEVTETAPEVLTAVSATIPDASVEPDAPDATEAE